MYECEREFLASVLAESYEHYSAMLAGKTQEELGMLINEAFSTAGLGRLLYAPSMASYDDVMRMLHGLSPYGKVYSPTEVSHAWHSMGHEAIQQIKETSLKMLRLQGVRSRLEFLLDKIQPYTK